MSIHDIYLLHYIVTIELFWQHFCWHNYRIGKKFPYTRYTHNPVTPFIFINWESLCVFQLFYQNEVSASLINWVFNCAMNANTIPVFDPEKKKTPCEERTSDRLYLWLWKCKMIIRNFNIIFYSYIANKKLVS